MTTSYCFYCICCWTFSCNKDNCTKYKRALYILSLKCSYAWLVFVVWEFICQWRQRAILLKTKFCGQCNKLPWVPELNFKVCDEVATNCKWWRIEYGTIFFRWDFSDVQLILFWTHHVQLPNKFSILQRKNLFTYDLWLTRDIWLD